MVTDTYPKISIVTPSYNQGQYIEQTILSVINQNYPNLEYIIIDGGSTDNTVEIIRKHEQHTTYWVSETDKGQSDALNKGLSKCTGEIFNWVNSDDYLEDNALFKVAHHFTNNPSADLVCGWCSFFDEDTLKESFKHRSEIFESVEETLVQQRINQPASFYRLNTLQHLGGINTGLDYVMDLDLWFRYLVAYGQQKILLVDDLLAHFRLHNLSKTVKLQQEFRKEENLLWYHLLQQLKLKSSLTAFFQEPLEYNTSIAWNCKAVNQQKLVYELCRKNLFKWYGSKNMSAARLAFLNQLRAGNIKPSRNSVAMFYNLFFKTKRKAI